MKLIDRSKFLKDKDHPACGERHYNKKRGEYPERIYDCGHNEYMMTVLEHIWLVPECNLTFGKYRKPNIWWFLFELWCPWYHNLYDLYTQEGINMPISQFLLSIFVCVLTLCCLGPVFCIIAHYRCLKRVHKRFPPQNEIYEKYKKIKFF